MNSEMLTPTEAAVVSSVEVREVNRLIDESVLSTDFYRVTDRTVRLVADAWALTSFYFHAAKSLTAEQRLRAIARDACSRFLRQSGVLEKRRKTVDVEQERSLDSLCWSANLRRESKAVVGRGNFGEIRSPSQDHHRSARCANRRMVIESDLGQERAEIRRFDSSEKNCGSTKR